MVAQAVRPGKDNEGTSPGGAALTKNILRIVLDIVFFEKRNELLFKSPFLMMIRLVENVPPHCRNVGSAYAKCGARVLKMM
jgi:hypothetical protein